jgi:glycosyltransferase involved in cell wall biosynthesis
VAGFQAYEDYISGIEPGSFFLPVASPATDGKLLISVIVPFFNTPDKYLVPLLDSLTSQSFSDWELIMADSSTDEARARVIEDYSHRDGRFQYLRLAENTGIAGNTNQALVHVTGTYVAFADHDDTLSPHALNEVAIAITEHPGADILYSDEDAISDDGLLRKRPFFKPAWSPHMFLEMNYTNHLSVIRTDLVREVGGLRPQMDGAQDYDLLLRLHGRDVKREVIHIPKILYHWREAEQSTSRDVSHKEYVLDAGIQALLEHLDRLGVDNDGVDPAVGRPGWYRIRPRQRCRAEVVVMVAEDETVNKHFAHLLQQRTHCEWVTPVFTCLSPDSNLQEHERGRDEDVLVIIRAMYLPEEATWLDDLAGVLALPDTAAVAPLLVQDTGSCLYEAGYVDVGGALRPLFPGADLQEDGVVGPVDLVRDVDGLSSQVIAFSRSSSQAALTASGVIDGRGCDGRLVLWGHLRFAARRVPYRNRYLNDNVALLGSKVVLRTEPRRRH